MLNSTLIATGVLFFLFAFESVYTTVKIKELKAALRGQDSHIVAVVFVVTMLQFACLFSVLLNNSENAVIRFVILVFAIIAEFKSRKDVTNALKDSVK